MNSWRDPEWSESAENELANLCLARGFGKAIASILHQFDRRLKADPEIVGESRQDDFRVELLGVTSDDYEGTLVIEFEIDRPHRFAKVLTIRWSPRRSSS